MVKDRNDDGFRRSLFIFCRFDRNGIQFELELHLQHTHTTFTCKPWVENDKDWTLNKVRIYSSE